MHLLNSETTFCLHSHSHPCHTTLARLQPLHWAKRAMQDTPLRKRHFCDLFPLISSVYLQLSRGPNKLVRILCLSHFIEAQARFKFFLFFLFSFISSYLFQQKHMRMSLSTRIAQSRFAAGSRESEH